MRIELPKNVADNISTAVAREPEGDSTFALAHSATMAISHDNPRSEMLLELTKQMIGVGRLDLAEKVQAGPHREQERRRGIAELVKAYTIAEQQDSALRVAPLETSDYYRRDLMKVEGTHLILSFCNMTSFR